MRDAGLLAVDLFAGAGGLSLGLTQAGFEVAVVVENDPVAADTYRRNLGHPVLVRPIEDVSEQDLRGFLPHPMAPVALVAGGPPCQGFSLQRRGARRDDRNELVLEFLRVVLALKPAAFLMENVGGLFSKHGRPFLQTILEQTADAGYFTAFKKLNAVHHGVPQVRPRAFAVGFMPDRVRSEFRFPAAETGPAAALSVRDAIGDLPPPPADGSPHPSVANHYRERRLSALNIERIRHVPPGGGRLHLPEHLQLDCHRNNPRHRHLDVYGRLSWDEPSVTLTARFDSFTRGRFAHPVEDRSLTLREGARIQTFPDDFVFTGSREEVARQIGNAVPPELARRLGLALRSSLEGMEHLELGGEAQHQTQLALEF